jgi:hypothetical protein
MRTHAQARIVANIEFKRWDPLTVRALGAFESGQNSGMLVKKMWLEAFGVRQFPRVADVSKATSRNHKLRAMIFTVMRALVAAIETREGDHGTAALHVVFHKQPRAYALHADQALTLFGLIERNTAVLGKSDHSLSRNCRCAEHPGVNILCRRVNVLALDAQLASIAALDRDRATRMRPRADPVGRLGRAHRFQWSQR